MRSTAWLDRGYYRTGDTIRAHFAARTLDGKPVQGRGELRLLKISYENGKPVETAVQTWPLDTNAEGTAEQQIDASQAGQYRLSYRVEGRGESRVGWVERSEPHHDKPAKPVGLAALDPPYGVAGAATKTVEGGYVFTIVGEGFDGAQFRFNHLELVPDKAQYAPGETVKLQINTDRADGTVLLFTRPANGVYLPPKVLRLRGKSTAEEIGVVQKDMPNFFVEAVTIAGGQVYTETREIVVPPEKRILERRNPALERCVQAGRKGQGEDQAHRPGWPAVRRLDRGGDLRQVAGIHLRRQQRARHQGVFLEVAALAQPAG